MFLQSPLHSLHSAQFLTASPFSNCIILIHFCTQTENPIYRAPETQHPNPLFQGKSPDEKSGTFSPVEKEPPVKFLQ